MLNFFRKNRRISYTVCRIELPIFFLFEKHNTFGEFSQIIHMYIIDTDSKNSQKSCFFEGYNIFKFSQSNEFSNNDGEILEVIWKRWRSILADEFIDIFLYFSRHICFSRKRRFNLLADSPPLIDISVLFFWVKKTLFRTLLAIKIYLAWLVPKWVVYLLRERGTNFKNKNNSQRKFNQIYLANFNWQKQNCR